ncbi:hypothetical protein [Catenulispora rubra]|uniref:hypothetical protein n=1 Tax=Catenulispora rubra TaxID=280293 RepID=UPI0018923EA5|nr:hypothetical protein [Catenulispora rubra]
MNKRVSVSRASAVRAALEAKARRDAERLERERKVEAALADFYECRMRAEAIREAARVRVAKILREAEAAAREPLNAAHTAIMALKELGETREQIAELTGQSVTEVRIHLGGGWEPGHASLADAEVEPSAA